LVIILGFVFFRCVAVLDNLLEIPLTEAKIHSLVTFWVFSSFFTFLICVWGYFCNLLWDLFYFVFSWLLSESDLDELKWAWSKLWSSWPIWL